MRVLTSYTGEGKHEPANQLALVISAKALIMCTHARPN
jgi:hypothetical protein